MINRRGFLQAVMAAAAATYTGLPIGEPVTPAALDLLPDAFTARIWVEDEDGRALTRRGVLRMRRVAPGHWTQVGDYQTTVYETGVAAMMFCEVEGAVTGFPVVSQAGGGLMLDNRNLCLGMALSISGAEIQANSS